MKKLLLVSLVFAVFYTPTLVWGKSETPSKTFGSASLTNTSTDVSIGTVEGKIGQTMKVTDKKLQTSADVVIDTKNTKIIGANKRILHMDQIKLNDMVAIIATDGGTATDGGKMRKILRVFVKDASASAQSKRKAVQGLVSAINGNILTLTHHIDKNREYKVFIQPNTQITGKNLTNASASAILVGMRVAAVGDLNPSGGILAKRIHILPGLAKGLFQKNNPISGIPQPSTTLRPNPTNTPAVTPLVAITPHVLPTPTLLPSPSVIPTGTP